MTVPLIVGMHGHGRIPEHRLRPCRRHNDLPAALGERVTDIPEMTRLLVILDLEVGDCGPAARAPVDDVVPLVNQAVVIKPDKNLPNGTGEPLVHRKAFARPVAGAAQAFQLVNDYPPVLGLPLPDPFDEFFTAEVVPCDSLFRQFLLDDVLRCYSGMVHPRHPEGVVALHPLVPNDDVLQHIVECMTHVQHSRDVRRGNDDGKRVFRRWVRRMEIVMVEPVPVPLFLRFTGLIRLG